MKGALSMTLLVVSSTSVMGVTTQCSPGFVHKDGLSGLMCMTNVNNDASCNSECCNENEDTCGGIDSKKTIECPFNQYKAGDSVWANTPATSANAVKVCCAPKATCAQVGANCPAGYKANTGVGLLMCAGDAKSCGESTGTGGCCIKDTSICGGKGGTCTVNTGKYIDGGKLEDDTWKKTALGGKTFAQACCTNLKKCSETADYTCPAGKKQNPVVQTCTDKTGASSADVKDCGRENADKNGGMWPLNKCCKADKTTCEGAGKTCTGTKYVPEGNHGLKPKLTSNAIAQTDFDSTCCSAKATCKDATCPAGHTKRLGVDAISCATDAKSCVAAANLNMCCEPDAKTCGGQTNIMCPYGFFNEQTAWTPDTNQAVKDRWNSKPATAANKNTNCCTARAICDSSATTTPTPTFTPAAPALKYGQHQNLQQKTTEASASNTNLLWLGCGAILGMGMLMAFQRRSASVRQGLIIFHDEALDTEVLLEAEE